jgi:hypothetical protein
MATTTNYSWTTPDDTDLVKDGAAAIRTLGSSVDTTTKALNPSTTLGDIEYRSSTANTNTRLGIGTTGQVLTVTGGVPVWATAAAGGTTLINTGGTSLTGATVTVSSIPTTYSSLQIVWKDVSVNADAATFIRFNGDTGSNYYSSATPSDKINVGSANSTNTVAENNYGVLDLYQYTQTSGRQVGFLHSYDNYNNVNNTSTNWYSKSAAITSVTFLVDGSTFKNGTIWVYGVS